MENYPWYALVDAEEPLLQGDFVRRCPIVLPPANIHSETIQTVHIETYDVVVMSQSCDLVQRKLSIVLVCPFWTLEEFGNHNPFFNSPKGKEELRRGNVPGYHLLNRCSIEAFETDYLVVDFRSVFGVSFAFLEEHVRRAGQRLRLLPPYREHLSQAFARFFMRVGLPVDIPPFR